MHSWYTIVIVMGDMHQRFLDFMVCVQHFWFSNRIVWIYARCIYRL